MGRITSFDLPAMLVLIQPSMKLAFNGRRAHSRQGQEKLERSSSDGQAACMTVTKMLRGILRDSGPHQTLRLFFCPQ